MNENLPRAHKNFHTKPCMLTAPVVTTEMILCTQMVSYVSHFNVYYLWGAVLSWDYVRESQVLERKTIQSGLDLSSCLPASRPTAYPDHLSPAPCAWSLLYFRCSVEFVLVIFMCTLVESGIRTAKLFIRAGPWMLTFLECGVIPQCWLHELC